MILVLCFHHLLSLLLADIPENSSSQAVKRPPIQFSSVGMKILLCRSFFRKINFHVSFVALATLQGLLSLSLDEWQARRK
jgi:hypothetical protein